MMQALEPYVGPRPFEREAQDIFFGREHEISVLASLVVAENVVLVLALATAVESDRAGHTIRRVRRVIGLGFVERGLRPGVTEQGAGEHEDDDGGEPRMQPYRTSSDVSCFEFLISHPTHRVCPFTVPRPVLPREFWLRPV